MNCGEDFRLNNVPVRVSLIFAIISVECHDSFNAYILEEIYSMSQEYLVFIAFLFYRENMPGHFKFKEYMPLVFRNLRERFNIDERLYAVGLNYYCCAVITTSF